MIKPRNLYGSAAVRTSNNDINTVYKYMTLSIIIRRFLKSFSRSLFPSLLLLCSLSPFCLLTINRSRVMVFRLLVWFCVNFLFCHYCFEAFFSWHFANTSFIAQYILRKGERGREREVAIVITIGKCDRIDESTDKMIILIEFFIHKFKIIVSNLIDFFSHFVSFFLSIFGFVQSRAEFWLTCTQKVYTAILPTYNSQ